MCVACAYSSVGKRVVEQSSVARELDGGVGERAKGKGGAVL